MEKGRLYETVSFPASQQRVAGSVAIVGMACRFPGSPDLAAFWRLLESGASAVTTGRPGSGSKVGHGLLHSESSSIPDCPWGAFIDQIDQFDPGFFQIAPVEARLMDPQQRLLLETSWRALDDAGINPGRLKGSRTAVLAGVFSNDYRELIAASGKDAATLYTATGNSDSTAIGRIAFCLGLEGPAMAVDTASSASLVAVHQAVSGLQLGEADLALAGGVNAILSPVLTQAFWDAGMLAADGRCKTFDAAADGYVRGEGCGVIVLKRMEDALADGNRIWGVIRGSAVNQDGASPGLTVPSGVAQQRVIAEALARAGLEPSTVDYLEAHGTGTQLGDPTEMQAAAAVYGMGRASARPLLVGSVKTNIGHLESAAGIAGLIKTVLSMGFGVIPKHLNFQTPNPSIDWARLPVQVVSDACGWPLAPGQPARAGISSFGFSGTNAHVVVESYGTPPHSGDPDLSRCTVHDLGLARPVAVSLPEPAAGIPSIPDPIRPRPIRFLPVSGKSAPAVAELADRYLAWLNERSEVLAVNGGGSNEDQGPLEALLADMVWTAGTGRAHFEHRAGIVFADVAALRRKLAELASSGGPGASRAKTVAFVFTGQGSQWAGMGRQLYETAPVARQVLDRCDGVMLDLRGVSLLDVMFGRAGTVGSIDDTAWTQPSLFALECALVELWASVGIRPSAVLGHSVGEIAAAYAAGVFSLEDGLRFAAARGDLMADLPTEGPLAGAMAAVFAPVERLATAVTETNAQLEGVGLSFAAENGTHRVVSGPAALLADFSDRLVLEGVRVERLNTSHGFHSGLMDPMLDNLESALQGVPRGYPTVPLISNVTGEVVAPEVELDGAYWRRHAREPVAFADGVAAMAGVGADVVLEIGPRTVLGPLVELAWPEASPRDAPASPIVLASLRSPPSGAPEASQDSDGFMDAVAGLYAAGVELSFPGLHAGEERRRISLPSYPFQRRRFWIDPPSRARGEIHPLLGIRRDSAAGETTFEMEISAAGPEWLADYRVFGRAVAPGTLPGTLAISAACSIQGAVAVAVRDFRLRAPLVIPEAVGGASGDTSRPVQVVVSRAAAAVSPAVRIFSRDSTEDEWILHGEGTVDADSNLARGCQRVDPSELANGLSKGAASELYASLKASGIECGPAFQCVKAIRCNGVVAIGEGRPPPRSDCGSRAGAPLATRWVHAGGLGGSPTCRRHPSSILARRLGAPVAVGPIARPADVPCAPAGAAGRGCCVGEFRSRAQGFASCATPDSGL